MEKTVTMTEGSIGKQLLSFALPLMGANLLQQLYNTADAVIVGRFVGANALAAVGSSSLLSTFMIYFFIGLSVGASVLISQFYGNGNDAKLKRTVHTAVAMSFVVGLLLMTIGIVFAPQLLALMNIPQENINFAIVYIRVYFLGMVPMTFYNIGSGILRAVGDSKTPLYCLAVTVIVNVLLDLFFVGPIGLGVGGAALATALSQLVAGVCVLFRLTRTQAVYKLTLKQIGFDWQLLRNIAAIGIPAGLQSVLVCFANVVVQSQINTFGIDVMAGFTAYMKVDGFLFMPIDAFSLAISNFTGQNLGAGNVERIEKGKTRCILLSVGTTILLGGIMIVFAKPIIGMFVDDATVVAIGVRQLCTVVPLYFIYAVNQVLAGVLRGKGKTFVTMLIALVCMCGLRVSWIFIVGQIVQDPMVIYISYPLTWIVTLIALGVYYMVDYRQGVKRMLWRTAPMEGE